MPVQLFKVPQTALSVLVAAFFDYPTLSTLAVHAPDPLTLTALADAVGVDRDLLLRVDARRQALPGWLVGPIAVRLGVGPGEVRAAAGSVLDLSGVALSFDGVARAAETPYPPDRLLGEPLYPAPLVATLPVVFPGA